MAELFIRDYCRALWANKVNVIVVVVFVLFFVTIPSRLIYNIPFLDPKGPLFRDINFPVPTPDPYPVNVTGIEAPYLSAKSAIAVDVNSKAVIYMKNPDSHLNPASTTKMVTALVAFDTFAVDKVASISSPVYEGQIMKLQQDEQITIKNLLYGLLVFSANDAAEALASLHPQGRDAFIVAMNQKVNSLGLHDTHFENPTGLDQYNHYSTVHDLALIGAEVMSNPELAEIVATKAITVTDVKGEITHELTSINELLDVVPGLKGIKTGWTESAGECLVAYTERDGHQVITVLLGSYDRFGETKTLVEWIFTNHQWQ